MSERSRWQRLAFTFGSISLLTVSLLFVFSGSLQLVDQENLAKRASADSTAYPILTETGIPLEAFFAGLNSEPFSEDSLAHPPMKIGNSVFETVSSLISTTTAEARSCTGHYMTFGYYQCAFSGECGDYYMYAQSGTGEWDSGYDNTATYCTSVECEPPKIADTDCYNP